MNTPLTEAEAECIAKHVADRLVEKMSDEEIVSRITEVWGRHLDRMLGRGVRKVVWTIFLLLLGIAFVKFDVLTAWLKP